MMDKAIVKEIIAFIEKKKEELSINTLYPNIIIRSDVLQILDRYCTVIYYPLPEDEGNNGFHISAIPGKDGEYYHFVFINTHQTLDKQVFTAAHELGHVWKVEDYICKQYKNLDSEEFREHVVNRFAAELLMPEKEFTEQYTEALMKIKVEDGRISFSDFLKLVSGLMYYFLSPMKAVLRRMSELGFISSKTALLFTEDNANLKPIIQKAMDRILREEGYLELFTPTKKKYIDGLPELLEAAEENELVSIDKIDHMRKLFDISSETSDREHEQQLGYVQLESEKIK